MKIGASQVGIREWLLRVWDDYKDSSPLGKLESKVCMSTTSDESCISC